MTEYIIANDEVGWGSLVFSLFCVGIRAPIDWKIEGLKDSKQLTPNQRERLRDQILKEVEKGIITYYIAERTHTQIDEYGAYVVLKEAHLEAVKALYVPGDRIIVDGNLKFDSDLPIESIIKADMTVPICSAASIIGKTTRDAQMMKLAKQFPEYGWDKNKGYYHKDHIAAIKKYGYTDLHRKSYNPVRSMIEREKLNE